MCNKPRRKAMTKAQVDSLRQHGLSVTRGTLHGLPVLLLALVSTALSCSPAPARALDKKPTKTAKLTASGKPQGSRRCHLKRPPHRPLRS